MSADERAGGWRTRTGKVAERNWIRDLPWLPTLSLSLSLSLWQFTFRVPLAILNLSSYPLGQNNLLFRLAAIAMVSSALPAVTMRHQRVGKRNNTCSASAMLGQIA